MWIRRPIERKALRRSRHEAFATPPRPEHARRAGFWLCLGAAFIGALGVAARIAGVGGLTSIVRGRPTTAANIALSLLLVGLAGALRWRDDASRLRKALSAAAALFVVVVETATLAEYLFHVELYIDEIVFPSERPAPLGALALALLGAAILTLDRRPTARARPSEWLAIVAGLIGFTSLVGFLFGASPLYRLTHAPRIGVSLPTSIGIILLSLGLLNERPCAGFMRVAMSTGPGGVLLRRLVPASILGPALLGLALTHLLGSIPATAEMHVMVAVLTSSISVLGLVVLAIAAVPLNRTHELLEASRAEIRNLVELAPDGIFVADREARFIDANDAGCTMLGVTRDEIIGKSIVDVVPMDHVEQVLHERAQLLRGRSLVSEWTLRRKDGRLLVAELSGKILPDGRWQGVARDITERRRLEREQTFLAEVGGVVASSLDLHETVTSIGKLTTQSIADVCVVYTVEDIGEPRRLAAICRNPQHEWICESLTRLRVDTHRVHAVWSELQANRSVLMERLTPEAVARAAQNEEHLLALRTLDPKSMIVVPLYAHGKLIGAMALLSCDEHHIYSPVDVHFAEQLAQRAASAVDNAQLYMKAQHAIRSRESVLGIVAHDLRNPLGTLLLQASLLRRHGGEPERRSTKPVEMIEKSGHRMSRIIKDLLDVARLEEGTLSVERTWVSSREAVLEAVESQHALVSAADLRLEIETARGLPEVWADRDRLRQIFENLLGNATKFTPHGGTIIVGAAPKGNDVLFWVADSGIGISEESLPYVFDRFWQANEGGRHGVGLGLLIVKGLVEAHGGRIWVESTPGSGTTFYFTIPCEARDVEHAREQPFEAAHIN